MKKRPTIIFDSTLKDVLVDDDIFIIERQDDDKNAGDSNKDDQNEDRNEDKNEDTVITNELKRQIVNI